MPKFSFRSAEEIRHAYILASPSADASFQAAAEIAGAAVCLGRPPLPCGYCSACRKVTARSHPDIQVISRLEDDKGKKKRELTVDQIRAVSSDAAILPNEAPRKVYIFREAETMNTEAQNAALKLLEERNEGWRVEDLRELEPIVVPLEGAKVVYTHIRGSIDHL